MFVFCDSKCEEAAIHCVLKYNVDGSNIYTTIVFGDLKHVTSSQLPFHELQDKRVNIHVWQ